MKQLAHPYVSQILATLKSKTGKDTLLTLLGQVLSAVLGFLFNIVLMRKLSVSEYGLFSLFMSSFMLLSGVIHFGWLETYVRFGAKYFGTPSFRLIRSYVLNKTLLVSTIFTLIVVVLVPTISKSIYKREDFIYYGLVAVLFAFINNLYSFVLNEFRVRGGFRGYFYYQVGSSFLKLILVLFLVSLGLFNLQSTVAVLLFITVFFLLFSKIALKYFNPATPVFDSAGTNGSGLSEELRAEIRSYNGWLLISMLTVTIIGNIDSHIIAHYHDNQMLAHFGITGRLTLPINFIILSLTVTLQPKLSAFSDHSKISFYFSRLKLFLIPMIFVLLLCLWLAPSVLIWIAGEQYTGITLLLRMQILLCILQLLANPVGLVLYAWGFSKLFAALNFIQMALQLIFDLLWIPRYGAVGALGTSLLVHFVGIVFIYISVAIVMRKKQMR